MSFAFIFESVGGTEWLVLLGVVLIVVGPKNLPSAARKLGQMMSTLRRAADEFKRQIMTMDQEVRRTVDGVAKDIVSSGGADASQDGTSGGTDGDGDPYSGPEVDYYGDSLYSGEENGLDGEAAQDDAVQDDVAQDGDAGRTAAPEPPKAPTDEELRAIKITVTTSAEKRA